MNALAARAASAWYLTSIGRRAGRVDFYDEETMLARLACCHLPVIRRICHASPAIGDVTGRLWQGCHSTAISLLVRLAHTAGLRRKSVDGREQVSLSAVLSSRPICHNRVWSWRRSLGQFSLHLLNCRLGVAPHVAITRLLCL